MPDRRYSCLTDQAIEEARKLIGVELRRRPRWTEAGKEMIMRFARAIGSRNPLYLSEELVSTNLFGSLVAHPTILYCFDDTLIAPKLPGIQSIYAGTDWQFHRPVVVHDRVTAKGSLLNVENKVGEFCGSMALQTGEVVYRDQDGDMVATATSYVMRTPRDAGRERSKYLG